MDIHGIGNGIKGATLVYCNASRHTGRTVSMAESVKEGDLVCFTNKQEADRFKRLCKEMNKDIKCIVVDVNNPHDMFRRPTPKGRLILDHTWVEEYYLNSIERCQKEIDNLQTQGSGHGEAHRQTKKEAMELLKWRTY